MNESHAEFIRHHVSINVTSRDADNMASIARAFGCRVSPDHRQVTIFVPWDNSQKLLSDVTASGMIAAVFSRPTTHETLQLKGNDAVISTIKPNDKDVIANFIQDFVEELLSIGYPPDLAAALLTMPSDKAMAITFTPSAAFVQTPGPVAGIRL